jgi:Rho-binding antiterminator
MNSTYKPISCAIYDRLEELAVKKVDCDIVYFENDVEKVINGKIIDFKTKNKEEFLIMESGLIIRLDMIKIVNGIESLGNC